MKELCGLVSAIVIDNVDPENIGRIKIRLMGVEAREEKGEEVWARLATLAAGNQRGSWFLPEIDDEVLVAFAVGETDQYYVIGAMWSTQNPPPAINDDKNATKLLRLRSGMQITLSEQKGRESFTIETSHGQKLALHDNPDGIEISDVNGNSVTFEPSGITVSAPAKVVINASTAEVNAGIIQVNAAMAKFSGVVQCDMLISNSVISSSYSPGSGNIW